MRDIPKVGNRHRRKVDVEVDVDEEVIHVNEGVRVRGDEIGNYGSPSQLRVIGLSVAYKPVQLVP